MKITIIYATNSGGTLYASQIVEEVLKNKGNEVILKEVQTATLADIEQSDLVILASCSWDHSDLEGQLPEQYSSFCTLIEGKTFPQKKFAVFALGDSSYTYFAAAADHLEKLVKDMQGIQLGESLKIDGFYFNQDENTKLLELWANSIVQKM
jgi:flavodoxin